MNGAFMDDLRSRLANRVQLTSDGHRAYLEAVESARRGRRLCPAREALWHGSGERQGSLQPRRMHRRSQRDHPKAIPIGTTSARPMPSGRSFPCGCHMRRFTRLTNAFSKKVENHMHMVALYTVFSNWTRVHKSLRVTPAMAAGLRIGCGRCRRSPK